MDRRERSGEAVTSLLAAFDGLQSQIWTALPGIIQSFDVTKRTARILPALKMKAQQQDGSFIWITVPELLDCPVYFPGGGGVTLTFPLKQGDECLVVFASRCIDNWWKFGSPGNNTAQEQAEFRMHDLSDGFCVAGISSVPKVIPAISATKAQLRTDDGNTFVEVDPVSNAITLKAAGGITLIGAITVLGNITQTGSITSSGDIHGNGTSVHTHQHSGVTAGGANSGPPI